MDSRLIAGAYSQHYRALEREEKEYDEKSDSIARAKKLSQETNKRRKVQAQKRKLEAKREEQRRQEILTKRREEQKQATEKYQRSHVPVGQRQNSGRFSPQRYGAPCLDDALQLIRRSPRRERPVSGRERVHSPMHENDDPLKRSYFNKPRHHSARPSSGRSNHQLNNEARAELMDYSLKNLTSSKSLFEQQLEQQQNILFQQQQQSLREFSNAVQKELEGGQDVEIENGKDDADNSESLNGSFSSLDSLERSEGGVRNVSQNDRSRDGNGDFVVDHSNGNNTPCNDQQSFYLNPYISDNGSNTPGDRNPPLNQDMTPSAIFQKDTTIDFKKDGKIVADYNGVTKVELLDQQANSTVQEFKSPLKQMSGDSLEESVSSGSNISLIKLNENGDNNNVPMDLTSAARFAHQDNRLKQQNQFSFNNQGVSEETANEGKKAGNSKTHPNSQTQNALNRPYSGDMQLIGQGQSSVKNEPVIDSYNPRYASAIGLSIWPGQPQPSTSSNSTRNNVSNTTNNVTPTTTASSNSISPYGKRTSSVVLPPSSTTHTIQDQTSTKNDLTTQQFQAGGLNNDMNFAHGMSSPSSLAMNPSGINTKPFVPEIDSGMFNSFKKQDFVYPLSQAPTGNPNIPQSHALLPMHGSTYDTLQQEIKQLSDKMLEGSNAMTSTYTSPPAQLSQNTSHIMSSTHSSMAPTTTVSPSVPTQQSERVQMIHHIPHGNEFVTGPVPVPAVRTIFPVNKPPGPKMASGLQGQQVDKASPSAEDGSKFSKPSESVQNENGVVEEDLENVKTLKGILKQLPPKVPTPGNQKGAVQVRDSIELAKMHSDKKVKKKSVRWATFLEETEDDYNGGDQPNSHNTTTSHNNNKQSSARPTSAKVVSQSTLTNKPVRASSAGTMRQPMANLPHNVSNLQITPKSNLPPNFTQPLNTSAPMNRPKAAAHIIMSSESHKDGGGAPSSPTASSLHKSQLEVKVKAVNNNFMSKVPVKVNANTTAEVYQVSNPANISMVQGDHLQQKDLQMQQNTERSRIRDNTSSKRVPLSNSTVTRTSIVPASTKINYPLPNGVSPSYSTTTINNSNAQQGPSSSTFDESKIRIDKTPTDEEISWLWNKVRNCLDKEGEDKQAGTVGNDQSAARQTPVLSTKIIDGNSLGFNTNLRPGSGYFYTRNGGSGANNNNNNGQNKIKPAVQQPGSYLRRYGLLQQRRVNSASGTPSNALAMQARAGSAGLSRYPITQNTQPQQQQQQQQQQQLLQQGVEGPRPLAFSYKPTENVSESTAAFVMAERLAKQSLTDSHIAVGMEDAHNKQEVYNRARGPAKAAPSALSMEEQRLMESLDRLNERLNAPEQKSYSGTVHYHQPYQPHLPGFRGHQGYTGQRHHQPASPRGQSRSQSARIRQQIRQYR